jgi:hypothetical protein
MLNIKQKQSITQQIQNGMKYIKNWIYFIFILFNKVFEFVVEQYESDSIEFEIYDEDPGKDDFIGR